MACTSLNLGRIFLFFIFILERCFCRIHNIELEKDGRKFFKISTFGMLKGGYISINVQNLTFLREGKKIGFSVQRTSSAGISSYMEGHSDKCMLEKNETDHNLSFDLFVFDIGNKKVIVKKYGKFSPMIGSNISEVIRTSRQGHSVHNKQKVDDDSKCLDLLTCLPLQGTKTNVNGMIVIYVNKSSEQGLYNLYFHNCNKDPVTLKLEVKEKNEGGYLSAGEVPLPMVLGFFAVVFFLLSCIWFYVLRQYWSETFKVHYLMFLLVMLKALDVSLNAVNYYYIGKDGRKAESWAVLHYIAHLLKGGLLFTTIILLGTGYFFIKHVLSDRDKKIFLFVIPLQIFDNIALIIMESTEEADADYATWKQIFLLVDLVCCGAVLFPVIWAIRHLQKASQTDGKAAMSLAKLKLFRQFYIMIVCYIYFTRIIVAIVKITVPFQYQWLDQFFMNLATLGLFAMTGYKFRPGSDNPYLHVPQEDQEVEMDEVITQSGLTENVTRVQGINSTSASRGKASSA